MSLLAPAPARAVTEPEFAYVPGSDVQPGGTVHDFRIGRFEIRNDEFVAFLNDGLLNLDNERGFFLYFDIDSGDVFIHSAQVGVTGEEGSGTPIFSASANPNVSYDDAASQYDVQVGFESHPVVGVSWYGAVKYCNWLTLAVGMSAGDRAYTEAVGTDLDGWHPVTIPSDDWAGRDLTSAEREALLGKLGYRLPMDGGDGAGAPSLYNEWFKAAAWDDGAQLDRDYGFGRDTITPADANYRCSGDPFEDPGDCDLGGTSPVGYYDGSDHGGTFPTTLDTNAYSLRDISGNVWEWMQDQGLAGADRRNRGGSFRSSTTSLLVAPGTQRPAESANDSTGFRIVQSVVSDLLITPADGLSNAGPWGGPYDDPADAKTYVVHNVTDSDVGFQVWANAEWVTLTVTGDMPAGRIPADGSVEVEARLDPACADGLTVGVNSTVVTFLNDDDDSRIERPVDLTVREPVTVSPAGGYAATTLFGSPAPATTYTLANASALPVLWSVGATEASDPGQTASWVTFDGNAGGTSGTVNAAPGTVDVTLSFDTSDLGAGTHSALVTFTDDCTGSTFVRNVTLTIDPMFDVSPVAEAISTGVEGGPFAPLVHPYTVRNLTDAPFTVLVTMTPVAPETSTDWLQVSPSVQTLAQSEAVVTATIQEPANQKPVGQYTIRARFQAPTGGSPSLFSIERDVTLDVTELVLSPATGALFSGPRGGPFLPPNLTYTLYNTALTEMPWTAEVMYEPVDSPQWLDVTPAQGTILEPDGTAEILVALSAEAIALPASTTHTATITFISTDPDPDALTTRSVELAIGEEGFAPKLVQISPSDFEPLGPTHRYRVGKFEVTLGEFVAFLNDALVNLGNARGAYLYFDTDSGNVYIHSNVNGAIGTDGGGTLLFDASATSCVSLDDATLQYRVTAGFERHPITHVSWYGAVKYCNWLTLGEGMDASQRAYLEGPTAADWVAVDAIAGDLILRWGFRLPMDGGADTAASFNEWYKAASWLQSEQTHSVYGFGRDLLADEDANYNDSGDPFEPGTTPVGFYDGTTYNPGGAGSVGDGTEFVTNEDGDENGYGLFDLTGNVAEWLHDEAGTPGNRAVRGGHFATQAASPSLTTSVRMSLPADTTVPHVGFRVAQALPDELTDISVSTLDSLVRAEGTIGGPIRVSGGAPGQGSFTVEITNPNTYTIDELSFAFTPANDYLKIGGVTPQQIPAVGTATMTVEVAATTAAPGISPAPPGDFVFVGRSVDVEPGPQHDFWIGRTEVTNSQFAAFLNATVADVRSETPDGTSDHMYFDLDSGSVYIHDATAGTEGTDAPFGSVTVLLYDASVGRIRLVANTYTVDAGYSAHPVVGVTWYGAVKYCNWLGRSEGIPAALVAYAEAPSPNLAGWHPVTIDDATWAASGLPVDARKFLVEDTLGYRLPMDDRAAGSSLYNEWYKATAWDPVTQTESVYGFGRDLLAAVDANYLDSGTTESDGTTPGGFFDGENTLFAEEVSCGNTASDPTATAADENGYGLSDACGNVAEWMQDQGGDISDRATRGGSWQDDVASLALRNDARVTVAPETAATDIGFRVVRGTGHLVTLTVVDNIATTTHTGHFILGLLEPFRITPLAGFARTALYRDDSVGLGAVYELLNSSDSSMAWEVSSDQGWLEVAETDTGAQSGMVAGGGAGVPEATISIDALLNDAAGDLGPGTHTAIATLKNATTGEVESREFTLTVTSPIAVTAMDAAPQEFRGVWGGPFDMPQTRVFELQRAVGFDPAYGLNYNVATNVNWLTVEPVNATDLLNGPVPESDAIPFEVSIETFADTFAVGRYTGAVQFSFTDPNNGNLTDTIVEDIELVVEDAIAVTQASEPWVIDFDLDPNPAPQDYTLRNDFASAVEVAVASDQEWLDVSDTLIEVLPGVGNERIITASISSEADRLFDGVHVAHITFDDVLTGHALCRQIELEVTELLSVASFDDLVASGVAGGPVTPWLKLYALTNIARHADAGIDWEVSVATPGADWVTINGGSSATGTLADAETTSVQVAIDAAATVGLAAGVHTAEIQFADLTNQETKTRNVRLTLVVPRFATRETIIAPATAQPGGPTHSYKMATFHTTNAEFAAFLNDAIANPTDDRGRYMFFDIDGEGIGDVYVNNAAAGMSGDDPGARTVKMFSAADSGQIAYVAGTFEVVTTPVDYSDHPVTGVSWYGAVKYCNWLTLDQGLPADQRCYAEGTDFDLTAWYPRAITQANWAQRDLNDAERAALVADYLGFRLPMDDGHTNDPPGLDLPDTYNEWYQAAAWDSAFPPTGIHHLHGFGRDTLELDGGDANFQCSLDPFEDAGDCTVGGTTPVGYYDGRVDGGFTTRADENAFGLFDMTGNAYQWLQGRYNTHPQSIGFRTVRGGGWDDSSSASSLETTWRTFAPPTLTNGRIGFRVVRAFAPTSPGDFDGNGSVERADLFGMTACLTGPGVTASPACAVMDLDGDAAVDLQDVALFLDVLAAAP